MLVFDGKHSHMFAFIRNGVFFLSRDFPWFLTVLSLIANSIHNTYANIYTCICITYTRSIYRQYNRCCLFFSASSPQCMIIVLHLFTVRRASIKRPLWICHQLCVCVKCLLLSQIPSLHLLSALVFISTERTQYTCPPPHAQRITTAVSCTRN